ncbi:MAG: DNA-3-methyladenine glycosylase I [Halieaceae bacterium]|nr:DNA-3-methyladenine glycosylase I [Halieaceae bacterium]
MPDPAIPRYATLYDLACQRKGGEDAVEALLPKGTSARRLKQQPSDRYLAEFTRKVFQSGFVWRVVDQKWDGFEEVFWNFDIEKLLMMPDDMLERKAQDPKIIRNFSKVRTVRDNAIMIDDTQRREEKTFGEFVAAWPSEDVVSLWIYLKKRGSRLGGNTGPFALRALGVDTFLLTQDVEGFLRQHGIIEGGVGSRKSLLAAQNFFNGLREESGRTLAELSRIVSFGFGANRVGVSPV